MKFILGYIFPNSSVDAKLGKQAWAVFLNFPNSLKSWEIGIFEVPLLPPPIFEAFLLQQKDALGTG